MKLEFKMMRIRCFLILFYPLKPLLFDPFLATFRSLPRLLFYPFRDCFSIPRPPQISRW